MSYSVQVFELNEHLHSDQARQLITSNGLQLTTLEEDPVLDVTIDGADEADAHLTCIKGNLSVTRLIQMPNFIRSLIRLYLLPH